MKKPQSFKADALVVVAKCIGCGAKREIRPFEIEEGDMPMCERCFMPMVAEKAKARSIRGGTDGS